MKTNRGVLMIVAITVSVASPALAEENWPILIGSDGESIKFQPPAEEVSYTPSGLTATPEAMKHSKAIKQLIAEEVESLPIQTKIVSSRMVGLLTWRVVEETKLVLARSPESVIDVRPANKAERERNEKEIRNTFGLWAAIFFILLIVSNLLTIWQDNFVTAITAIAATIAVAVAIAATIAVIASTFIVDSGIVPVAASAFAAFAAFAAAVANLNNKDTKRYRIFSGAAGALMVIAIIMTT